MPSIMYVRTATRGSAKCRWQTFLHQEFPHEIQPKTKSNMWNGGNGRERKKKKYIERKLENELAYLMKYHVLNSLSWAHKPNSCAWRPVIMWIKSQQLWAVLPTDEMIFICFDVETSDASKRPNKGQLLCVGFCGISVRVRYKLYKLFGAFHCMQSTENDKARKKEVEIVCSIRMCV